MIDRPPHLRPVPSGLGGLIEAGARLETPAERAAAHYAETRTLALEAARLALATLTEAAHQCREAAGLGDALKPGVADALKSAATVADNYADKIGRML